MSVRARSARHRAGRCGADPCHAGVFVRGACGCRPRRLRLLACLMCAHAAACDSAREMAATAKKAEMVTAMRKGKHHIGDFLPKEQLDKVRHDTRSNKGPTLENAHASSALGARVLRLSESIEPFLAATRNLRFARYRCSSFGSCPAA